ncbi:flagellar motor protein MotD [Pleionea litopenaei]|uniref:Flagellar motor protein MotD n=1 Tax=Pleionea litopenaei TaxID=3070815 RepID=A0AA51RUE8_9GAMM|nr:flagellar motor protein MotD [Pleionea sp. HL-JVS1]WMS87694.1 flagellar motor protein MotD [Pleionea sp. HL-JVS1]
MLRKSQVEEEDENTDRWLVSYADFITLLFAFFVVMYSISQINQGKYRILSQSLLSAFDSPEKSRLPIQEGDINRSKTMPDQPLPITRNKEGGAKDEPIEENYLSSEEFDRIETALNQQLSELIKADLVSIKRTKNWLEIDLSSAILFESGSDRLTQSAQVVIEEIAKTLRNNKQIVSVRGHTDNIPIETEQFRSNWALSAGRAVAVVRLLQRLAIPPQRLQALGFGEFQPLESNATAEGRAKNRRVTIAISRYELEDQEKLKSQQKLADKGKEIVPSDPQAQGAQNNVEAQKREEESKQGTYEVVRLPGGGLLIRGKKVPKDSEQQKDN